MHQAAKIMTEFKEHSQEEVAVPPTISYNLSSSSPLHVDGKSSGYIMSRPQNGSLPRQEEYKLEYWGRYEVPSPASGSKDQVEFIDTLVAKFREAAGITLGKVHPKKRSFGSRFMNRNSSSKVSVGGVEGAESPVDTTGTSLDALKDVREEENSSHERQDIPVTFTAASPTGEEGEGSSQRGSSTSPEDPADHHSSCRQIASPVHISSDDQSSDQPTAPANLADHHSSGHQLTPSSEPNGRVRTESSDFDTLPELANLKGSSEFQALSLKKGSARGVSVQHVRLLFSGVTVFVYPQMSQQIILKKSIQNIACCAQVS